MDVTIKLDDLNTLHADNAALRARVDALCTENVELRAHKQYTEEQLAVLHTEWQALANNVRDVISERDELFMIRDAYRTQNDELRAENKSLRLIAHVNRHYTPHTPSDEQGATP